MITYEQAGVNIQKGNDAVLRIKKHVAKTNTKQVLTQVGGFGSGFCLKKICTDYQSPVLVQSMDGVGTKTIVARMANHYAKLGYDLLSACANDILVMGAKPLTFLDYLASADLNPDIIESIIIGLSEACCEQGVALVGGEMAQMPDTYLKNEWDVVGIVTGVVDRDQMITGEKIQPGDVVLAFASNGLHTNGYSLARKLLFDSAHFSIFDYVERLQTTLDKVLLAPHLNYTKPIMDLLQHHISIHGMAHITGGGIWDNIPRILPVNCDVVLKKGTWIIPPIFELLVDIGKLDEKAAYHTFNMGIGFVCILPEQDLKKAENILSHHANFKTSVVGYVSSGKQSVRLIT